MAYLSVKLFKKHMGFSVLLAENPKVLKIVEIILFLLSKL